MHTRYHTLRLILGDQLNAQHSWFRRKDDGVLYLIAELKQETGYVKHHVQKICAFFAAMEKFAHALSDKGHHVVHLTLDDTCNVASLNTLITDQCQRYKVERFEFQRPDEYRLAQQLAALDIAAEVDVNQVDSEHFLLPFDEIPQYFTSGKAHKMEFFYRKMRRRFDLLMEGETPAGGQWNYDADNRNKLKDQDLDEIPAPKIFRSDIRPILDRLQRHGVETIGETDNELRWPTTRREATALLKHFCERCLPNFGRFQDAMTARSKHRWSLYHSRLSFAINSKMLHPKTVIDKAIDYYYSHPEQVGLAQIEGFVRQILGWREFVRGIYWANMPDYAERNALAANGDLPSWFWSGDTKMHCQKQAIEQSLRYAYAHHIQRLMITGNFALLAGIDPDQVDQWYLGIYVDAIEWVEMPNTRGMSQYADGGLLATKPYAAGGNYVSKMSDYCNDCHYRVKDKTGPHACPLNSLYWHFLHRHREQFESNPRMAMIYRTWDRQGDNQQTILERGQWCLDNLEDL